MEGFCRQGIVSTNRLAEEDSTGWIWKISVARAKEA